MNLNEISKYKKKVKFSTEFNKISKLLRSQHINTICHSARCPNIGECYSKRRLTFMILGDKCTRNCLFCNVHHDQPDLIDDQEAEKIVNIALKLNLKYSVITSVTRDDLDDGGCSVFLNVIDELKDNVPDSKVEVLIPDFNNDIKYIKRIACSRADVIAHNIETIERLYSSIRPLSDFQRSLSVLKNLKIESPFKIIKSGFMVGLGESVEEIADLLKLLYQNNVDVITIGQYFQPSNNNVPVKKIYSDEEFDMLKNMGKNMGFAFVFSGRFVRSSYSAEEVFIRLKD